MSFNFVTVTAVILSTATSAAAFEFTGGTFGVEYTSFPDFDDLSATTYSTDVEFSINPSVSFALSMSSTSFDMDGPYDVTSSGTLLHAIYNVNDAVKLGAFVGNASVFYYSTDTYGIEAAYDLAGFELAGYAGAGEYVDIDTTLAGLSAGYAFSNGFGINAAVDRVVFDDSFDDYTMTTSQIGVEYGFANGVTFYAEAGQYNSETDRYSNEESFVNVGATFGFGPEGDTSFDGPVGTQTFLFMGPA